jgi:hypothetical protein
MSCEGHALHNEQKNPFLAPQKPTNHHGRIVLIDLPSNWWLVQRAIIAIFWNTNLHSLERKLFWGYLYPYNKQVSKQANNNC